MKSTKCNRFWKFSHFSQRMGPRALEICVASSRQRSAVKWRGASRRPPTDLEQSIFRRGGEQGRFNYDSPVLLLNWCFMLLYSAIFLIKKPPNINYRQFLHEDVKIFRFLKSTCSLSVVAHVEGRECMAQYNFSSDFNYTLIHFLVAETKEKW